MTDIIKMVILLDRAQWWSLGTNETYSNLFGDLFRLFYQLPVYEISSIFSALQFYRKSEDITTEMEEMDTEHAQQNTEVVTSYSVKEFFGDRTLWKPLTVACMLQVAQQFSGINAVSNLCTERWFSWLTHCKISPEAYKWHRYTCTMYIPFVRF